MNDTTLCLACSASLPPSKSRGPSPASASFPVPSGGLGIFTTRCCHRPICPTCLSLNPRLARYDPCLACFGGVSLVKREEQGALKNVDGAVRDEDTFIVGDVEDDEDGEDSEGVEEAVGLSPDLDSPPLTTLCNRTTPEHSTNSEGEEKHAFSAQRSLQYHLKTGDTLQGLALRFGVDGRELCRLNKLPPSTLSTTPHILHTRTTIILPCSAHGKFREYKNDQDKERENRRARERAERRLQTLTKEVDWRIAKAYVALADDADEAAEYGIQSKVGNEMLKKSVGLGQSSLEMMAVDRYLDDDDWEESERREGRRVSIPRFPYFHQGESKQGGTWHWWKRTWRIY